MAVPDNVVSWVRKQIAADKSPAQIRSMMEAKGWPSAAVSEALETALSVPPLPKKPEPKKGLLMRFLAPKAD